MEREFENKTLKADGKFAFDGELGALYSPRQTEFRVWSPYAESVSLNLYKRDNSQEPYCNVEMLKEGGVWSTTISGDLHGIYYTYIVTVDGAARETIDIYAKSAGVNGIKGMIIDLRRTDPDGWENSERVKLDKYTDAVICELHVRDFSMDKSGHFKTRGKFLSFCEENPTNEFGETIGLEYLQKLGITHIQIQPVFDFETSDESRKNPQYNWGYDPLNYNLPEGSYSSDPSDGSLRVKELKQLIKAAHDMGMGIIMDVVYNHTYSVDNSPFTKTFPDYYYRHNADGSLANGSCCGNEFASERAMARKFIVDSLCYWAEEYKIDGFRFDLMGLLDIETLNLCARKLKLINPSIILYGEGWAGGASPLDESRRALKKNAPLLSDYAMFSDDFRDSVRGSLFDDSGRGFVGGNAGEESAELIKSVMCAGISIDGIHRDSGGIWTDTPQQAINYVEVHDNLTLYDKLKISMPDASNETIIAADKFAAALVFFSQGIPLIQLGQEMLRSKPDNKGGYVHDSYKSPDSVNSIKWNDITVNKNTVEYYRGLIALRKRLPQLRLGSSAEIRRLTRFENISNGAFAAHIGDIILLVNPADLPLSYNINAEARVYADHRNASDQPLYSVVNDLTAAPLSITLAVIESR